MCKHVCVCVWTSSLTSLSCPKHSFKSKGGSHRRGWRPPWGSQFNFLHTSQVFSSSTGFWTLLKVWMCFSPCPCLIEDMSRSLWKCHERHEMSRALLACLFLSQRTHLCSVALLRSLQSLQCSLSEGNKRYWYTWTSNMGTIPSLKPVCIHSFQAYFLLSFHPVFSPSSYSWSRWWFTRWLLALISVRPVLWWREGFFSFFPLPLPYSLFFWLFFSLSRWSLWIWTCRFWELHVSLMRPGNRRATVDIPCIAIDAS